MNHSLVSALWVALVAGVAGLGLGACQPAPTTESPSHMPAAAAASPYDTDAGAYTAARVQRGEGRVHILLARELAPARTPASAPAHVAGGASGSGDVLDRVRGQHADRVTLGAGDALGRQMFERYASIVRSQMRDDDREFVDTDSHDRTPLAQRSPRPARD